MGRGNWFPTTYDMYSKEQEKHIDRDYELVYVQMEVPEDPEDQDEYDFYFQDFLSEFEQYACNFEDEQFEKIDRIGLSRNDRVMFEGRNYQIITDTQGECDRYAIGIITKEETECKKAEEDLAVFAQRFFDGLEQMGYKLLVRTGPWTCSAYSYDSK